MKARESAQVRGAFSDRYRDAAGLPKDTPIIIVLKDGVHDQHVTFGHVHQEELWSSTGQGMECKFSMSQMRWARGCASSMMSLAKISLGLVQK